MPLAIEAATGGPCAFYRPHTENRRLLLEAPSLLTGPELSAPELKLLFCLNRHGLCFSAEVNYFDPSAKNVTFVLDMRCQSR
jgi:hypothetical protein